MLIISKKLLINFLEFLIKLNLSLSDKYIDKTILITGAGGSIGKNLFFELLNSKAKKIILIEQDEFKLFNVKRKYDGLVPKKIFDQKVDFRLGNLSDKLFIKKIFFDFKRIDYIFIYDSKYKHVELGEKNIFSFIKNNIFLTYDFVELSIKMNVKNFVFISTDKAKSKKSIMGYTKNICEKIIIYFNQKYRLKIKFLKLLDLEMSLIQTVLCCLYLKVKS